MLFWIMMLPIATIVMVLYMLCFNMIISGDLSKMVRAYRKYILEKLYRKK